MEAISSGGPRPHRCSIAQADHLMLPVQLCLSGPVALASTRYTGKVPERLQEIGKKISDLGKTPHRERRDEPLQIPLDHFLCRKPCRQSFRQSFFDPRRDWIGASRPPFQPGLLSSEVKSRSFARATGPPAPSHPRAQKAKSSKAAKSSSAASSSSPNSSRPWRRPDR